MQDPTVPQQIAEVALDRPDRPFLAEVGGRDVTYGEFHEETLRWAAGLRSVGVGRGDRVLTLVEPSVTAYAAWTGMAWLGVTEVACNTDYRGPMLEYAVNTARVSTVIVSEQWLERFSSIAGSAPSIKRVIVVDATGSRPGVGEPFDTVDDVSLLRVAAPEPLPAPPELWDTSMIVWTSGTTGPSKGVLMPWGQQRQNARAFVAPSSDGEEAYYSPFPMYHALGRAFFTATVEAGARLVVRRRLSVSDFWNDIRAYNCTITCFLGPIAPFLMSQPESPSDADNPLRYAIMLPVIPEFRRFAERFGVSLRAYFGMTEIGAAFSTDWGGITDHRSCGQLRPGFEARLVDAHDFEVEPGEVGELMVRHDEPWSMCQGYFDQPARTAQAWTNGWFHTGDAFRKDEHGNFYFVDRVKDVIRRRGENISSFEVEALVCAHSAVAEAAAVAVPSEFGEDDVKICVVRAKGSPIDAATLVTDLIATMPRFMVPRYVEFVETLPRTEATQRVQKVRLRELSLNDRTWDRESAGVAVPR